MNWLKKRQISEIEQILKTYVIKVVFRLLKKMVYLKMK